MVRWPGHPCRPVRAGRPSVRSRPRERSTSSSRSSPRPRHQTGKRSERSSLAENVTNSAQQEEICKIHQMPRERSTYRSRSSPRPPDLAGTRWTPLLSGGESDQFCITGSRKCAKYAKWAIYLTVLVFSRLSSRGLEKDRRPRPGRRQGLGIRPARGRCAPLWRRM